MSRNYKIALNKNYDKSYKTKDSLNDKDINKTKNEHKLNRSTKLRKYAMVYKSYVRKSEQSKKSKSPRRIRKIIPTQDKKKKENINSVITNPQKKSLNAYQKFVQSESKKDKYKNMPGKERLTIIADIWKKIINN